MYVYKENAIFSNNRPWCCHGTVLSNTFIRSYILLIIIQYILLDSHVYL